MSCFKKKVKAFAEDNRGVSMVEFAFIVIVLLIIVLGTIEFGLIWYTKYVMACATREGARYATLYQPDSSGNRILPCNLVPTIETFVQNYLKGALRVPRTVFRELLQEPRVVERERPPAVARDPRRFARICRSDCAALSGPDSAFLRSSRSADCQTMWK